MNLNEFQRRAVECTDGPVLVLAGPGSGKTKTIIERIKYLVTEKQIVPERILVVTFTRYAAKEMKDRYRNIMNGRTPVFSTIHALCYEVVRRQKGVPRLDVSKEGDLDKLVTETKELFAGESQCLEQWQNTFDYIMVDEFQDTSLIQMEILFMLSGGKRNIMVVGDDDQAIYGFRGGCPEVFTLFMNEYPYANIIQLKVNYRSRESIVRLAENFIAHNMQRMRKDPTICQKKEKCYEDGHIHHEETICIRDFESRWEQMEYIIKEIYLRKEYTAFNRIAVLFRTKIQFRLFLICAKIHALPVCCKESKIADSYFFIDEIRSFLRVIVGSGKREDYIRILNILDGGLDRNLFDTSDVNEEIWLQKAREVGAEQANSVHKVLEQLMVLRRMPPYLALCHLFYHIEYKKTVMERLNKDEKMIETIAVDRIFHAVLSVSKAVKSVDEILKWFEEENFFEEDGVMVMTLHASKGLEFDTVFLPDLNEGIIPNKKAVQSFLVEEERRLLYVGITRAKESVYLSYVKKKNNDTVSPSMFMKELVI